MRYLAMISITVMMYDRQQRQIINKHPNTLEHDLLMIDIQCKKICRSCSNHVIIKTIVYVLDKTVMLMSRVIKKF